MANTPAAVLEIYIYKENQRYQAQMNFSESGQGQQHLPARTELDLDLEKLSLLAKVPERYGQVLSQAILERPKPRALLDQVQAYLAGKPLRIHLKIDPEASELHHLAWELLWDSTEQRWLLTNQQLLFSRFLPGERWERTPLRSTGEARALVVVANPQNISAYQVGEHPLAPVDVDGEFSRARQALLSMPVTALVSAPENPGNASLMSITAHLQDGYDILYLVCHGALGGERRNEPILWLEGPDGQAQVLPGKELADRLGELGVEKRPRLVVMASCQSAGLGDSGSTADEQGALAAIGPLLARAGIPAVLAMQGNVSMETVKEFMPAFFRELLRNGQVERAMAVARGTVCQRRDAYMPVLYLRLADGQLFKQPGEPELQFPALHMPPPPPTFTGRKEFIDQLLQALSTGDPVVRAIQGLGGIGKTCLAQVVAARLAETFPGGVLWVDVGQGNPGADPASFELHKANLTEQIALRLQLDLKDYPSNDRRAMLLQSRLQMRGRMLVVLDDVWQIKIGLWLMNQVLPSDRALIITSRDLGVCNALAPASVVKLGVLEETEALELLEKNLGALLEGSNVYARDIVRLLEGHPLALELSARQCVNGLDDLPWLSNRLKKMPGLEVLQLEEEATRHTSVGACLSLSYTVLNSDLQRRFCATGVFARAPFDLEGLAAVWSDADLDDASDAARQLLARGLIHEVRHAVAAEGGEAAPVYTQQGLLRAFAKDLLQKSGLTDMVAEKHATYYAGMASRNWREGDRYWDQVNHAWNWVQSQPVERQLQHLYSLDAYLRSRRRLDAYQLLAAAILARLELSNEHIEDQAVLLDDLGFIAGARGEPHIALKHFKRSLEIVRQSGDPVSEAKSLNNLGQAYADVGDLAQAVSHYQQALDLLRTNQLERFAAPIWNNLGQAFAAQDRQADALEHYQQALNLWRISSDLVNTAVALNNIGILHARKREYSEALEHYGQALTITQQVGDRAGEAFNLGNMGQACASSGKPELALQHYQNALIILEEIGDRPSQARILDSLAGLHAAMQNSTQSLACYQSASLLWQQVGDQLRGARCLMSLGRLHQGLGQNEQAIDCYTRAGQALQSAEPPADSSALLLVLAVEQQTLDLAGAEASARSSVELMESQQLPQDARGVSLESHRKMAAELASRLKLQSTQAPPGI